MTRLQQELKHLPADLEGLRYHLAVVLDAISDEIVPKLADVDQQSAQALGRFLHVLVHGLRLEFPMGETSTDCALTPDAQMGHTVALWKLTASRGTPPYHRASPALKDEIVKALLDAVRGAGKDGDEAELAAFWRTIPIDHAVWIVETAADVGMARDEMAMLVILSLRRINKLLTMG